MFAFIVKHDSGASMVLVNRQTICNYKLLYYIDFIITMQQLERDVCNCLSKKSLSLRLVLMIMLITISNINRGVKQSRLNNTNVASEIA